jgi:hypothetical protein
VKVWIAVPKALLILHCEFADRQPPLKTVDYLIAKAELIVHVLFVYSYCVRLHRKKTPERGEAKVAIDR